MANNSRFSRTTPIRDDTCTNETKASVIVRADMMTPEKIHDRVYRQKNIVDQISF